MKTSFFRIFFLISAGIAMLACTSCSSFSDLAAGRPPQKDIDLTSATMVEFPDDWPQLSAGMSREEFSAVQFVKPWRQLVVETMQGASIEMAVYSFDFYEYFFLDNALTEASAENMCQYFTNEPGVYKGFFPVPLSRAKEMFANSTKPFGFIFNKEMPNKAASMKFNNKVYYVPSLDSNFERFIYENKSTSASGDSSKGNNSQYEQVLVDSDFRLVNNGTVKTGSMAGGSWSPTTGISFDSLLYVEFIETDNGTMVYIETDSLHVVLKSRAKSFSKAILMHMDCMNSETY